jgi:hypothetical protein
MSGLIGVLCLILAGPLLLRNGDRIEADQVAGFHAQGVELRPNFEAGRIPDRRVIPWAEVLDIQGGWGAGEPYRSVADAVHRAERRLARGDISGVFEALGPHAGDYLNERGPTSGAIGSALALARVLRTDAAGGVEAWLAWRAAQHGPSRPWIDDATGLVPALPPVWTERDAREVLSDRRSEKSDGGHADELARLYLLAARATLGQLDGAPESPETRLRADTGVRLVWEMVRAQAEPERSARLAARDVLRRRVRSGTPAWQRAWIHLGVGASMLSEADRMESDAGAAELLQVVLTHQHTAPHLSDLAGALLVDYFIRTDRPGHADAVRSMDLAAFSGIFGHAAPAPDPGPDTGADTTEENP